MDNASPLKNFISGVLQTGYLRAFSACLSFLVMYIAANYGSVKLTADIHYWTTVISLGVIFSKLGLDLLLIKEISPVEDKSKITLFVGTFLKNISRIVIAAVIFSSIIFLIMRQESIWRLFELIVVLFFYSSYLVYIERYRVIKNFKLYEFFKSVLPNIILLLLVIVITADFYSRSLLTENVVHFSRLLAVFFAGYSLINFLFSSKKENKFKKISLRNCIEVTFSTSLISLFGFLIVTSISSNGNDENLAAHGIILKITYVLTLFTAAVSSVIAPDVSNAMIKGGLKKVLHNVFLVMIPVALIFITLIITYGHELLALFGGNYTKYYKELIIFSIGACFNTLPLGQFLIQMGMQQVFLKIMFFSNLAALLFIYLIFDNPTLLEVAKLYLAFNIFWNVISLVYVLRKVFS